MLLLITTRCRQKWEALRLTNNLSQGDNVLCSDYSMPTAAVIKPLLTTATRHKRNKMIAKMMAVLSVTGSPGIMTSSFISPVNKVGLRTSRSIPVGFLWKVLDDTCPSSFPKCRGQDRGCRLSEKGEEVLLRTDANIVKAQLPACQWIWPFFLALLSAHVNIGMDNTPCPCIQHPLHSSSYFSKLTPKTWPHIC